MISVISDREILRVGACHKTGGGARDLRDAAVHDDRRTRCTTLPSPRITSTSRSWMTLRSTSRAMMLGDTASQVLRAIVKEGSRTGPPGRRARGLEAAT